MSDWSALLFGDPTVEPDVVLEPVGPDGNDVLRAAFDAKSVRTVPLRSRPDVDEVARRQASIRARWDDDDARRSMTSDELAEAEAMGLRHPRDTY